VIKERKRQMGEQERGREGERKGRADATVFLT
jgi:hypothetical protein